MGAAEPFPVVPDRRNVRAGDDGELGGGSGISHANAAGDTAGGSAGAGATLGDGRPEGPGPVPEGAGSEGAVREGARGEASPPDGGTADSAGPAAAVAERVWANGGDPKLYAGESSTGACSPAWLDGASRSGAGPFGLVPRADPMVSAGNAGTPSAMVASTAPGRAASVAAALPLGPASLPPLAEASIPFPAAGAPLAPGPASGVPSDTASSGDPALAGADLAAVGCCGDRLGGADDAARLRVLRVADQVITGSP